MTQSLKRQLVIIVYHSVNVLNLTWFVLLQALHVILFPNKNQLFFCFNITKPPVERRIQSCQMQEQYEHTVYCVQAG